ncbi:MAG: hypothetical protein A3J10_02315 [Candidatus Sungbacteria bacterium RIFCSPLOWO2_02_FULL_54_10]|uniref:Type II secretion system protein GspG C-terminal domain-containing protein n=2 Tax=Candidatus Sungiibacteriota TaxID=1817917 RepID=A0A1G2L6A8_9BACT|nr:MAG: hypothetical protein A2679_01245 [Candidatus Sungbacteria bacterium RIFCSPHIGHO2_01_FULL_54_26]OHA03293.1 MAG: hypothetical protein A3C92_03430 [Candidatus Sungbacteria bacterium RIFCSPHIGHO2_02_FULL_53_17]OHA07110.1 MAG: hypothetical protein A3B34_02090 [Candidatus Sungbacteria bacterium RIFCSPLOWO2_01_FULL_54_21]OHA12341.1 MAG: hypothetical protein A3J10_02315 [Candidatus Sungbacteria bacterium RIFCSPLOWO2_02_FULL_54_10]
MSKRISGFTLIELLVVISIIGLLSSIVLTSVNSARSKARNVREKADVKQIITALEFARSNSSTDTYPSSGGTWVCLKQSGTCWRGGYSALPAQAITDLAPYLPALPATSVNTSGGTSCYAYDSHLYHSNHPAPIGSSPAGPISSGRKRRQAHSIPASVPAMTPASTTAACATVTNLSERIDLPAARCRKSLSS